MFLRLPRAEKRPFSAPEFRAGCGAGFGPKTRQELADMGHKVVIPVTAIGGGQAIRLHENGVLEAGSDPRKDGCAIGY